MAADQSWVSESALRRSLRSTSFRVSSSRRARTSARAWVRPFGAVTFARPLQLLFQASCQDHEVPLNRLALWLPISLGSLSRRCVGACARHPFGCLHRGERGLLCDLLCGDVRASSPASLPGFLPRPFGLFRGLWAYRDRSRILCASVMFNQPSYSEAAFCATFCATLER